MYKHTLCFIKRNEETNIGVTHDQIQFKGIIKWEDSSYSGGMYVYLVELLHEFTYHTPKKVSEGIRQV